MKLTKESWKIVFKYWLCLAKMGLLHRNDQTLRSAIDMGVDDCFEWLWNNNHIADEQKIIDGDISG